MKTKRTPLQPSIPRQTQQRETTKWTPQDIINLTQGVMTRLPRIIYSIAWLTTVCYLNDSPIIVRGILRSWEFIKILAR